MTPILRIQVIIPMFFYAWPQRAWPESCRPLWSQIGVKRLLAKSFQTKLTETYQISFQKSKHVQGNFLIQPNIYSNRIHGSCVYISGSLGLQITANRRYIIGGESGISFRTPAQFRTPQNIFSTLNYFCRSKKHLSDYIPLTRTTHILYALNSFHVQRTRLVYAVGLNQT